MEWIPKENQAYSAYDGCKIELTGRVEQKQIKNKQLILYLNQVTFCDNQEIPYQNKIMCYLPENKELEKKSKIGRMMKLTGNFRLFEKASNPGEFDQNRYYHIQGIDAKLVNARIITYSEKYHHRKEFLYELRCYLAKQYEISLPPKEASLMKSIVLGEKQDLDQESKKLYQKAGIAHILAISGLHIAFLGMAVYHMLRKMKLPVIPTAVICIFLMIQYGDMTGMSSSAYRAVVMFSMRMLAQCLKRSYDLLTAMVIACALLLIEQPMYIYHSGFLFSFGAILGIGLMAPVLCDENRNLKKPEGEAAGTKIKYKIVSCLVKMRQSLQSSISVTTVQFPLILAQYYSFPVMSPFLNLLILPLMSILFGNGILYLFLQILKWKATKIPALVIILLLKLFEKFAEFGVYTLSANWITGCPAKWKIICYIIILAAIIYFSDQIPKWYRYLLILSGILLMTSTSFSGLQITILDVGQGDGVYFCTEQGHHYLIDGGSTSKKNVGNYQLLPFLKYQGVSELEAVFLTHLDEDHISGAREILQNHKAEGIDIKNVILAAAIEKDDAFEEIVDICRSEGVKIQWMRAGDCLKDGKVKIECLFPAADEKSQGRNAKSLVLQIQYEGFCGLFMGDIDAEGEHKILNNTAPECQLLKVAHHGSQYSNSEEWLEAIKPQIAVISYGKANKYGHPHQQTLERLKQRKVTVYKTAMQGAVRVEVRGNKVIVRTFHGVYYCVK